MSDNTTKQQGISTNMPTFRSQDYRTVFSNFSRLRVSQTEFAISFGYMINIPVAGTPFNVDGNAVNVTEDRTDIVLTPHHTKLLALTLLGAVTAYENEYGKINLELKPPVGMDKISAAVKELMENTK